MRQSTLSTVPHPLGKDSRIDQLQGKVLVEDALNLALTGLGRVLVRGLNWTGHQCGKKRDRHRIDCHLPGFRRSMGFQELVERLIVLLDERWNR